MTMIQLIACIGMIAGLFIVLHVSPRELSDSLFSRLTAAPGSIRADINETTRRKKAGFLRREITEAQAVLAASGRADRFPMVCFTSLLCFALGACIAIAAGNAFLVPVLAVGLMLTPFWYVKLTAGSFKKDVAAELETALSVITTAYLRTKNFQQAVEENSFTEGRTVQAVAGTGRSGAHRGDYRPGADHRPGVGDLPQEGVQS